MFKNVELCCYANGNTPFTNNETVKNILMSESEKETKLFFRSFPNKI